MAKLITGRTKQIQILRSALFGKSVKIRMQALLLLAQDQTNDGGWLLETALKFEKLTLKN